MQVNHQQPAFPGASHPLAKHSRSQTQDPNDQDPHQDQFTPTPLKTSAALNIFQPGNECLLHR
jgi:hypothetical protein